MQRPIHNRKYPGNRQRGAAMVEFAIVMPLLLLVMFGVLEIGVSLIQDTTLNKSVRDVSRYVAANYNLDGCYTDVAKRIVSVNMNNMFGSTYSDWNTGSDLVTVDMVCVDETTGAIGANVVLGTGDLCGFGDTPPTCGTTEHLHIRTTALYHRKMLIPNLTILNWTISMTPTLRAESLMRVMQ